MKVVQYGVGKMAKYTMRYVFEKGWEIVGAFDRDENKFGKDISVFIEDKKYYGIKVQSAALFEEFLYEQKPDIVIITTMSLFSDIYDSLEICAKCGVNAITSCEEAFFPLNSNPALYNKIDKLAKQNNCTITGSGYQDVYWGNLIASIAGSSHAIKRIVGKSSYNIEDYGIALAKAHGAGLSLAEFEDQISSTDNMSEHAQKQLIENQIFLPSYMWNVNGWLADKLGLEIISQQQQHIPEIATKDIYSNTLQMEIKKGCAKGMRATVTSKTKQGITIISQCVGKVYDETEFDFNSWTIEGEPSTTFVINQPSTMELTCATIVNRLPDVIKSPAGYISTSSMDIPRYKNSIKIL